MTVHKAGSNTRSSVINSETFNRSHSNSFCNQIIQSYVKKDGNFKPSKTAIGWV